MLFINSFNISSQDYRFYSNYIYLTWCCVNSHSMPIQMLDHVESADFADVWLSRPMFSQTFVVVAFFFSNGHIWLYERYFYRNLNVVQYVHCLRFFSSHSVHDVIVFNAFTIILNVTVVHHNKKDNNSSKSNNHRLKMFWCPTRAQITATNIDEYDE